MVFTGAPIGPIEITAARVCPSAILPIPVRVYGPQQTIRGRALNLSSTGICVVGDAEEHALDVDHLVRIETLLPGAPPFTSDARVVHTAKIDAGIPRMGLQFLDLGPVWSDRILELVRATFR